MLIGSVLLISMVLGLIIAGYQVRRNLDAELSAAISGARQTVASAFEDLPNSEHPARDLRQLVQTFDGNRHVSARLVSADGRVVVRSLTGSVETPPPHWFASLVDTASATERLAVPATRAGPAEIILTPNPELDIRAAWNEFLALILVLVTTSAAGLGLVYLVIGAALKPLTQLALRFEQISEGDYTGRVRADGPSELVQLQRGFNHMVSELEATTSKNRNLSSQLARLQEEERLEIARDLHDEIGPHLFGVNVDAEMIAKYTLSGQYGLIRARVEDIQTSIRHMQREVRDLLGRLRPPQATEFGLGSAVEDMIQFWRSRHPETKIDVTLPIEDVWHPTAEVIYRVIQEAVNNAIRHGKPKLVKVIVQIDRATLSASVTDDGSGKLAVGGASGHGLGLIGMRERVEASGGELRFGPNAQGVGWTVFARLPLTTAFQPKITERHDWPPS